MDEAGLLLWLRTHGVPWYTVTWKMHPVVPDSGFRAAFLGGVWLASASLEGTKPGCAADDFHACSACAAKSSGSRTNNSSSGLQAAATAVVLNSA